jgi:hypothetical protein
VILFGTAAAAFALALAAAPRALAVDIERVPEALRLRPSAPELSRRQEPPPVTLRRTDLTVPSRPDYGPTAPIGGSVRVTLVIDTDLAVNETTYKAAELAPDRPDEDALRECVGGALWDVLFDAVYDVNHDRGFNLVSELQSTATRAGQCIANHFHFRLVLGEAIGDWLLESAIDRGANVVTHDRSLAAFINWAGVTGLAIR